MLQVADPDIPARARGVPLWMFDSAACLSSDISGQPRVPVPQLRVLKQLLATAGGGNAPVLVEHQHCSDFSVQGGADAHETQTPPGAARSVPATDDAANATDITSSGTEEDCQTDFGIIDRKSQLPNREGGAR